MDILLIRHARHDDLGVRLSGRRCGIPLSTTGRGDARKLSARLSGETISQIQASPTHRTLETAAIIGSHIDRPVHAVAALDEIDFGDWTGRTFTELDADPRWHDWNRDRETGCAARGETMAAVRSRLRNHLERARQRFCDQTVAMVTHCDIIRTIIADILGLSLNGVHRFDIAPASVSRIVTGTWGSKVISLNEASA